MAGTIDALPRIIFALKKAGYTFVKDREADGLVGRVQVRPLQGLSLEWLTRYEVNSATFNENTVTLRYEPPWLWPGVALTLLSVAMLFRILASRRKEEGPG